MTADQDFNQLASEKQRSLHLMLCEEALGAWAAYTKEHAPIRYADSVVGMRHEVDVDLPHDALRSAKAGRNLLDVQKRYLEPICAMQDLDLVFPEYITFAYYAIYNCFRRYVCDEEIEPWLIVNQALSGVGSAESMERLVEVVLAAVDERE